MYLIVLVSDDCLYFKFSKPHCKRMTVCLLIIILMYVSYFRAKQYIFKLNTMET